MKRAFAEIFSKNVKCHFMVVFYYWATLPIFFDTASTGAVAQRLMRLSSKQEIPGSNQGSAFKENRVTAPKN